MLEIPLGLRTALESGECVLFVGAGIGEHLITREGTSAPRGDQLAEEVASHFHLGVASNDLAKVSRLVEIRKSRVDLESFLSRRLASVEPDAIFRWIATIRWSAIFTTNYDNGIERAYELTAAPPQQAVSISTTAGIRNTDRRFEVAIHHLHGKLGGEGGGPIVITDEDYTRYAERRRMLFERLRESFATNTFLYVGYSARDSNWQQLHAELRREFAPTQLPQSYRVDPFADPVDIEIQRSVRLDTLAASFSDFVSAAQAQLRASDLDTDRLERIRSTVPADLRDAFSRNPAAVARLLSSWTYVNEAPFNAESNIASFLQGDRPNWSLLASQNVCRRDIEEEVFDALLDYVTSDSRRPGSGIILGAAGYGITTLLMGLATRFVREGAGPVLFHRPGTPVIEGDLEFATTIFGRLPPIFVVDDAGDCTREIDRSISALRDLERPCYFLLGARKNEWIQSRGRRIGKSFELQPLSDLEIEGLLGFLAANHALGRMEGLPRELQIAAVKQRHGKELLVVLRETTEGRGFDAIIEDEFRGIQSALSREAYLAVCCQYQHGAMMRDGVLAACLQMGIPDVYGKALAGTEGIVVFECMDESSGIYAARARHRLIAAIVWERCGDGASRTRIAQRAIGGLNLSFSADVRAFEQMVHSDRLVDGLQSLDDKIRFFEAAIRKDPDSPYVRQHFARMFYREERYELALAQIDQGIALRPRAVPRVVYHTRGVILASLAVNSESTEVGRRRLAQAEAAFKQVISLKGEDEYAHQGLAELYLKWAQHTPTPEESSAYLAKCEDAISAGLRRVRNKEGLWIVSAAVEDYLGNEPKRLEALEKAVKENPQSVVARYLLGRALRRQGDAQRACTILKDVVQNFPDEFRAATEYAISLYESGEPITTAIAVMRLSTLYGCSDPRFLATLGGLLFLNSQFGEANDVFEEGLKRELSSDELEAVRFRPVVPQSTVPYRRSGRIFAVRAGYSLIEVPGQPRVLMPATKYRGIVLRSGMPVTFDICFSAKGPVAERPSVDEPNS